MLKGLVTVICNNIIEIKEELNSLDAAIGDGDHGTNMARGAQGILDKIDVIDKLSYGDSLNQMAMILISSVGGASGPLYGTALMKLGGTLKKSDTINVDILKAGFKEAVEGIKMRGKSDYGCKTMLDVLIPAYDIFEGKYNKDNLIEVLKEIDIASKEGVKYTSTIKATKGRASYLGDRSIGTPDPGATSSANIMNSIYKYFKEE